MKVALDNRVTDPARRARLRRPHRVPHRPGGPDERPQARAGRGGDGRPSRALPGDGLTVVVHNPAPPGEVPHVPGSGQGLIGLTERATLAGGRFAHGGPGDGGFEVRAWLPWG